MKKIVKLILFALLVGAFVSCSDDDKGKVAPPNSNDTSPKAVQKTNTDTKVFMHFMVWYETPESTPDGTWGQHWKAANMPNPSYDEATGTWSNLYTRYPPLTGPYASNDKFILEYQLLLMKYAGVDGTIPDWYGVDDLGGNEDKTRNMNALFAMSKEVGMDLAVCYEDRFKSSDATSAIASIKTDLKYLQDNYFGHERYAKVDGQPLLLIFGPITLFGPANWTSCFADLSPKPAFYTLIGKSGSMIRDGVANGEYAWPTASYKGQYATLEALTKRGGDYVAGAWPGFKDCYLGVDSESTQYEVIEHRNGLELEEQLNYALEKKPARLQIATWNDYGEGTMIEPTIEFGFTFLEKIQKFTGVSYTKTDLEQIKRFYDLRVKFKNDPEKQKMLDEIFKYLRSLQMEKAVKGMNNAIFQ
jgi:hypothetical protein